MGHVRLGSLPRTRRWQQVVGLIAAGAEPDQVASATLTTAEQALKRAYDDIGLTETVWLLTQLPLAAREENFVSALRSRGIDVSDAPSLAEITCAVADAIDRRIGKNGNRSDLGEMAQMAAVETISRVVGDPCGPQAAREAVSIHVRLRLLKALSAHAGRAFRYRWVARNR